MRKVLIVSVMLMTIIGVILGGCAQPSPAPTPEKPSAPAPAPKS